MNYNEGILYMKEITKSLNNKVPIYQESFVPYKDITIQYPEKKGISDYRLSKYKNGQAPTHSDICIILFNLITEDNYTFSLLSNFLSDIYINGTNTIYAAQTLEDLKYLIYWTTLQEEINYPQSKGYAGIRLPFCRYYEGICCTKPQYNFSLYDVINRCNNHGFKKPTLYNINNAPKFYY